MEQTRKHNLFLRTDLNSPLAQNDIHALRAAVDGTLEELTVFVSLKSPSLVTADDGWSAMQRRIAELYVIAAGQALRNRSDVSVDVVPVDFCAYSPEDMAPFKDSVTLVGSQDDAVFPAWWPSDCLVRLAIDPSSTPVQQATDPLQTSHHAIPWTAYPHVAVGGTFDHLHIGHKILLTATILAATKKLTCGLSADALLEKKKYKEFLESYRVREINALLFLRKVRKDIIIEFSPIADKYGPTAVDESIRALVVSQETLNGSEDLNTLRAKKGFPPMRIMAIDLVALTEDTVNGTADHSRSISSTNTALKLSSTAIRAALAERQQHAGKTPLPSP